jgi:hypothetical protein
MDDVEDLPAGGASYNVRGTSIVLEDRELEKKTGQPRAAVPT